MAQSHSHPFPGAFRPVPRAATLGAMFCAILCLALLAPAGLSAQTPPEVRSQLRKERNNETPLTGLTTNAPPGRAIAVVVSAAQLPHAEENWLVAVGVNRFNEEHVNPLLFPKADAEAVHAFFTRSGLVPRSRAYLHVTDHPTPRFRPKRLEILESVQYAADHASENSTILIFLAGHGFLDGDGNSYFFPEDGKLRVLRDSAVSIARLNEILKGSKARRKVVFVDACRNNPTRDSRGEEAAQTARFLETLKSAAGQVTLASCGPGQASYEDASLKHGVFTAHLLKGLSEARPDERGLISVTALQDYLSRAVPDWARENRRPIQNPWMWGEMSVPIPLAIAGQTITLPPVRTPEPTPPLSPPQTGGTQAGGTQAGGTQAGGTQAGVFASNELEAQTKLDDLIDENIARNYSLDRQITRLEAFIATYPGTRAAAQAQTKIEELRGEQARAQAEERRRAEAEAERRRKEAEEAAKWKKISSDGRFKVSHANVILDTKTNLEWVVGPDQDTTYDAATRWVSNLTVAGGGWRMPTGAELRELYQQGKGSRNMDPVFETTGWWVWAEPRDSSSAWAFYFANGRESWDPRSYSSNIRAFAVRSRR